MTASMFMKQCLILDTNCLINLSASKEIINILRCIPCPCRVSRYVLKQEMLSHDLQPCIDQGLLLVEKPLPHEAITIVQIHAEESSRDRALGAGEIETIAIAAHRDWLVATDDLNARKRLGARFPSVEFSSTPELMKHWVEHTQPSNISVKRALEQISLVGNYVVGSSHPLYSWWNSWF